MDNGIVILFFAVFAFIGGLFGYDMGASEGKAAIRECEKTLPRNVECRIIAVPVDKD